MVLCYWVIVSAPIILTDLKSLSALEKDLDLLLQLGEDEATACREAIILPDYESHSDDGMPLLGAQQGLKIDSCTRRRQAPCHHCGIRIGRPSHYDHRRLHAKAGSLSWRPPQETSTRMNYPELVSADENSADFPKEN